MSLSLLLLLLLLFLHSIPASFQQTVHSSFSSSDSPWLPTQNKTLLSPNSTFTAGFLPLPTSLDLFTFSIWFNNHSQNIVVWSANPNFPVNSSASLSITPSGELRLSNSSSGDNLWPSKPVSRSNSTLLTLRETGDLVYGTNWSSFAAPTNTILPNQAINGTTLSSLNGKYRFVNATVLFFRENLTYWTGNNAFLKLESSGKITQQNIGDSQSLILSDFGETRLRRLVLDEDGNLRVYSFDPSISRWTISWQAIQELCVIPGKCGPNAICMYSDTWESTFCTCPPGFRPISGNSEACERKIPVRVPENENSKFLRLDFVNFSGGSNQTDLRVQTFSSCQTKCMSDPKCLGFGFKYYGSGYCVLQLERMLYGYWSPGTEMAMFIRVDKSETDRSNFTSMLDVADTSCPVRIKLPLPPNESNTTTRNILIVTTLFAAELISGVIFFWAFLKRYIKYRDMARTFGLEFLPAGGPKRFGYAELKDCTNNFSNLIGRGAFGDVYKGELNDHRVVAVKCLKNVSGGDAEFWAEVTIIARMHHLNLVRLWGFCAEKGQRILVYEHVPNGSLDKFLFRRVTSGDVDPVTDKEQKPILDWNIRYRIALGVARAIAYLHEECLEWVLHCDIKPENILLGDDFCPKISDFGLAKLKKKEDIVTKSRIRGTRGYMAPEWVKMDPITPKADVYSFGMVLLEIVSGVRNNEIQESRMDSEDWYLPLWAFDKVFKEMRVEDILDDRIKHTYDDRAHLEMVDRMVRTAMWCLQDRPEMRPSMGKVAKMLEGSMEIMEPQKPKIFFIGVDA